MATLGSTDGFESLRKRICDYAAQNLDELKHYCDRLLTLGRLDAAMIQKFRAAEGVENRAFLQVACEMLKAPIYVYQYLDVPAHTFRPQLCNAAQYAYSHVVLSFEEAGCYQPLIPHLRKITCSKHVKTVRILNHVDSAGFIIEATGSWGDAKKLFCTD